MQNWIFLIVAVILGTIMPTQAAINNKLSIHLSNPILAALTSFLVGSVTLILYCLFNGTPLTNLGQIKNAPPSALLGGFIGAIYVACVTFLVPRLGVALLFSIIVAGQMLTTLFLDHYGVFGVPIREVSLPRVLGILLIIGGVILVRKF